MVVCFEMEVEIMQKCKDGRQATAGVGHNFEKKINSFQITHFS